MKSSNWKHKNFPGTEHLKYTYANVLIGKCFNADHITFAVSLCMEHRWTFKVLQCDEC